jgi:hypothetical protein
MTAAMSHVPADLFWVIFFAVVIWPLPNVLISVIIRSNIRRMERRRAQQPTLYREVVRAGPWMGVLERLLIVPLAVLGEFEAVGFVVAAKGFVFPGLTQALQKVHPNQPEWVVIAQEVYLIGTFASFAIAVLGGLFAGAVSGSLAPGAIARW